MAISHPRLGELQESLRPIRERLIAHPMYTQIRTMHGLRIFMEHHIYAVWDFMSLLKTLQGRLTCVDIPWMPVGDRVARRLINEIVLGEESDEDEGGFISHYEMYHEAMEACSADTSHIDWFLEVVRGGASVPAALEMVAVPLPAAEFVRSTWAVIESGSVHAIAAAFTLGREDIIPDMFRALVADLCARFPNQLTRFHTYLERHIQLDEEHHTPMALAMLESLCGDDEEKWRESAAAARLAIEARIRLWDGITAAIHHGSISGDGVVSGEHSMASGAGAER